MLILDQHGFGRSFFLIRICRCGLFLSAFGALYLLKCSEDGTNAQDPCSRLDDDDQLSHGETVLGMDIPEGFRVQLSPSPALDQSLVKRGVLLRLGLGWFGGVITRRAHQISRCMTTV